MKDKVKAKLEEKRSKRVQIKSLLPKVNKDLFLKLKDQEQGEQIKTKKKSRKSDAEDLLKDDRFKDMFSDERFEVDTTEDAYKLLNPVISKLDENKKKRLEKQFEKVMEVNKEDLSDNSSGDERIPNDSFDSEESSDDDEETQKWAQKVREEHKKLKVEKSDFKKQEKQKQLAAKLSAISSKANNVEPSSGKQPKFYELKEGEVFGREKSKDVRQTLRPLLIHRIWVVCLN
jgi:ribosome biogenesis protein ENP2